MYKTKKQYSVIFKAPLKSEHIKIVVFEKKKKVVFGETWVFHHLLMATGSY